MSPVSEAESITLHNRKPLAPPFHRHIAKSKLIDRTCQVGDNILIYDIVATEPEGVVRVTRATRFQFE
jgi:ABC-type sulfate/molybdate transport systems ATPase subunit